MAVHDPRVGSALQAFSAGRKPEALLALTRLMADGVGEAARFTRRRCRPSTLPYGIWRANALACRLPDSWEGHFVPRCVDMPVIGSVGSRRLRKRSQGLARRHQEGSRRSSAVHLPVTACTPTKQAKFDVPQPLSRQLERGSGPTVKYSSSAVSFFPCAQPYCWTRRFTLIGPVGSRSPFPLRTPNPWHCCSAKSERLSPLANAFYRAMNIGSCSKAVAAASFSLTSCTPAVLPRCARLPPWQICTPSRLPRITRAVRSVQQPQCILVQRFPIS